MARLTTLLEKLTVLHRQHAQIEREIAHIESEIVASGKPETKPRRKRATPADAIELVKPLVKVLHDAGEPLPRQEIADRLNLPPAAVSYRLHRAITAKFVEKAGHGRYRVSAAIPVL